VCDNLGGNMKTDTCVRVTGKIQTKVCHGMADFKCNACGNVVQRDLGWKAWTPSFCGGTGRMARLYRISAPSNVGNTENEKV
jgi:hypothetical protein